MVYAPAVMGEVGIAPRHTPLVTRLKPGEVRVMSADEMQHFYVSGGILEVQTPCGHRVGRIPQFVPTSLDEAAVQEAKKRAEEAMQDKSAEFEYAKAQSELRGGGCANYGQIERIRKSTSV